MLPGKLVVFQREPRRKRGHARQVFAHAHAGEEICKRCRFYTSKRVQGLAGVQSRGGVLHKLKAGRNPKDGGWLSEPVWQAARHPRKWSRPRRRLGGTGVAWYTSHSRALAMLLTASVADAGSLIRTSSQKKRQLEHKELLTRPHRSVFHDVCTQGCVMHMSLWRSTGGHHASSRLLRGSDSVLSRHQSSRSS